MKNIIIVRTPVCRRSDLIMKILDENNIPYIVKYLNTEEGSILKEKYGIKASPGIIVDNRYINVVGSMDKCDSSKLLKLLDL